MLRDLRYALRIHRRNPVFVTVVLASVALSIGANTLIVSLLYSLLLRPIPFLGDLDRMVLLSQQMGRGPWMAVSAPEFREWQARQTVFTSLAAFRPGEFNLSGNGEPERVKAASGSPDLFSVLRVRPAFGRDFRPDEFAAGAGRAVIVSHALWTRRLGADPSVIGRTIRLDSESYLLVGIMPPGFTFPDQKTDVWVPLVLPSGAGGWTDRRLQVIAHLKDGTTLAAVKSGMDAVALGLASDHPATNQDVRAVVRPLRDELVGNARPSLAVLSFAVAFLFLVACINVATLQFARNESRRTEIATRAALGASRAALLRQFLIESLLLALVGGALGVGVAYVGLDLLLRSVHLAIPSYVHFGVDRAVLLFATLASVLTGLAVGIAPIADVSRSNYIRALREGGTALTSGRRARRVYTACAVVEVTLAFALLAGSATSLQSLRLLQSVGPGFQVEGKVAGRVSLPESPYPKPIDRRRFFTELLSRLHAVPGVTDAALISRLPAGGAAEMRGFDFGDAAGGAGHGSSALYYTCSPRLFETLGIHVLGRSFAQLDPAETSSAAIVSGEVARRFWKTERDALGQTVRMRDRAYSIIGVADDTRHFGLHQRTTPAVYRPYDEDVPPRMDLAISSPVSPGALAPLVKQAALDLDRDVPVFDLRSLRTFVEESITVPRVVATMLPVFAASALMMAFIGLFGVISYSVAQRTREIAIRRAFGASGRDIARTVVRHALFVGAAGVLCGGALSFVLIRLMIGFFYGITAVSPVMLAGIGGGLLALSVVAACLPSLRAFRVEPVNMLRQE